MNKITDNFYWKPKNSIVNINCEYFEYFAIVMQFYNNDSYRDYQGWIFHINKEHGSEYNHAIEWLYENDDIYVIPKDNFENIFLEKSFADGKYILSTKDYEWLGTLL